MEQPIIRVGNAVSKIECDRQLLYKLDTATAVEFPGAEYARRHRPLWDGRWHPVDPIRGTFPTGMLTRIKKIIPIARIIDERVRPPTVEYNAKILKDITFADHQEKAIKIALDKARGILALAVNAGKTEVGIAIASHIAGKCIWIVHRKDLLHQTSERIKLRTGQKAALFGDGCWDDIKPDQKFVIIMPQTVQDELRYFCDLVKDANVIMLDEAHRTGAAATWYKVTQAIPAFYRIGLTGTPETGDPVRDLRLEAATGPIIDQVKTKDLQAIGWSSKCKVMYHKVENESVPPGTPYMDARRMLIEENPNRNAEVVAITMSEVDVGRRCLIICDTIRHARIVAEILRGENVRCKILTGKHSGMIRSQARKDMRSGALEVIVATPIFDEGVDLPELEVVVLAAGGKSAVRVLQRIGRALRIAPGKAEATIHDFIDTGSKYTFRHSMDRVRTCRKEGFNLENAPDTDRLPKHTTR